MKTVTEMAREAGLSPVDFPKTDSLKRFADLVRADEREKVAAWMLQRGYATGHGDTVEDLLKELEWQVVERERQACAELAFEMLVQFEGYDFGVPDAIRARGRE